MTSLNSYFFSFSFKCNVIVLLIKFLKLENYKSHNYYFLAALTHNTNLYSDHKKLFLPYSWPVLVIKMSADFDLTKVGHHLKRISVISTSYGIRQAIL